jgi:hypothetical protein
VGFRTVHEIWGNEQRLEMADGRANVMAKNACDGLGDLVTNHRGVERHLTCTGAGMK